jgi:N-acetyl sugar amidotransferase
MRYCRACVLPNSRPGIELDETGLCTGCRFTPFSTPERVFTRRKKHLLSIFTSIKKRKFNYDCVVPASGGKDSTYLVYLALKYDLKPLVLTWRTPGRTAHGQLNLDNLRELGVDHLDISINRDVESRFCLEAFKRHGNPSIPMHMAIHSLPILFAEKFNVPLVLWAENPADTIGSSNAYTKGPFKTKEWFTHFGCTNGSTSLDWISPYISENDLLLYSRAGVQSSKIKEIFLGHFFDWKPREVANISSSLGRATLRTSLVGYHSFAEDDDSFLVPVAEWLKWYKFGISRLWDNLSVDIRAGAITREEAIDKLQSVGRDIIPSEAIEEFCKFTKISIRQFHLIAESFRSSRIWKRVNETWTIPEFLINSWIW